MESKFKTSEPLFKYQPADLFNDKATKSKIYRHLVDINDVISEDDIRNIKVTFPGYDNFPLAIEQNLVKH